MRIASYLVDRRASFGLVRPDGIIDLGVSNDQCPYDDLLSVLQADDVRGVGRYAATGRQLQPADVRFLPVIPSPAKIICAGVNYRAHADEAAAAPPEYPVIFTRFADTQVGHDEPIVKPHVSEMLDYEGELAVVIGRGCRDLTSDRASDVVAGYACYNDASVRDWQRHSRQWTPGKNFPGTGAFGPHLVTRDELPEIEGARLTTRVNGEVRQQAGLDRMIFSVPTLLAYVTTFTPLSAGDVVLTGTPGGVGAFHEPPSYLHAGDVVEVEVEGVGVLRNTITDGRDDGAA